MLGVFSVSDGFKPDHFRVSLMAAMVSIHCKYHSELFGVIPTTPRNLSQHCHFEPPQAEKQHLLPSKSKTSSIPHPTPLIKKNQH